MKKIEDVKIPKELKLSPNQKRAIMLWGERKSDGEGLTIMSSVVKVNGVYRQLSSLK